MITKILSIARVIGLMAIVVLAHFIWKTGLLTVGAKGMMRAVVNEPSTAIATLVIASALIASGTALIVRSYR